MTICNRANDPEDLPPKDEHVHPNTADKAAAGAAAGIRHTAIRPRSVWRLGLGALLLIAVGVAYGASQHLVQSRQVMKTTQQQRDFVPTVRVAKARAADGETIISLPGTTLAFAAANIFARASGYIETRKVDIGDHVKAGDLLAQITAHPESGDVAAGAG
jgi:multidrug efflux pump subunit AcrA (membrane-fusion protein)